MSNLTTYKTWFRARIINRVLGFIAAALNTFFACLPVDTASTFGGWMARRVGPKLRVTKNARRELNIVFPELKNEEIELIIIQMWDNLGRTAAEHPHLAKFNPYQKDGRVEIEGAEYIDQLREDNKPGIFFSGHLANWELVPLASTKRGLPLHLIYRKANNLFFDRLVQKGRLDTGGKYFPKGPAGSKDILRVLNSGDHLAMLIENQ
jgi:KDO2-lipid IV(A) lauroyltransferase